MKKILLATALFIMKHASTQAQQVIPLYNGAVPGAISSALQEKQQTDTAGRIRISQVVTPTLTAYFPAASNHTGTAVIICPGGGYTLLAATHEGSEIARLLASWGITAFVLKYRLPNAALMKDPATGPLQDAQRALQLVRSQAAEWKINTRQVGIMGFSAGGHLAATAATHFTSALIDNPDHTSLRPDFQVLAYPVISFADSICHKGSREKLIGKNAPAAQIALYSNETQVTRETPPAFLLHAADDKAVPVQNTLYYYEALLHHQVAAEMHVYPCGGHGFGMHNATTTDEWTERLHNWMKDNQWIR